MARVELDAPVRELLAAVLEAVGIPFPATVGDEARRHEVLAERAMHAAIALQAVLGDGFPRDLGVEWTTEYLRERLAEHPPTGYQQSGGEQR